MKTKIALFAATALLIGCSSVSESIPTVKIEKRKPKTTVQTASFGTNASSHQIRTICETQDMRDKVIDENDDNDAVRIMIVEDGGKKSRILSEVEVDCRDYFLKKSLTPVQPSVIRTVAPTVQTIEPPRRITRNENRRYTYVVQRGDTVWAIARQHCTTVQAITRLNGLGRGNVLDIGQSLKLPDDQCR